MTAKEPAHRDWVKLWIKDTLIGSLREELTADERGTWFDFLLLAGHSRVPGVICANERQPMSPERIAAILNIDLNLLSRCMGKFLDQERIEVDEAGLIRIVNWAKYQYSDYDRVKRYREKARKEAKARPAATPQHSRKAYGQFSNVLLTAAEYEKLAERFGDDLLGKIENLSEGIKAKGYKYKSHYAAILAWDRRDGKRDQGLSVPTADPNKGGMRIIE